jgi:23S rRNA (guanine745-N1)-methyltransferase
VYRCPVCRAALTRSARTYDCPSGHSFDIAREGYVNLLAGRGSAVRESGDDRAMVHARRAVLDGGHYDELRARVLERVGNGPVLDAGCGEGFYSRPLAGRAAWIGALDVSKTAVRLAATRAPDIDYAVANVFRLPIDDGAMATVLSVFSPIAERELARVLRPDGRVLVVGPGPDHLIEMKGVLFDEPAQHTGLTLETDALVAIATDRVTYRRTIRQPALDDLLAMTPYSWRVTRDARERLARTDELSLTMDFVIATLARGPSAP